MNPNIQKLYDIAGKPERLIIGLMSGTSLDGLDIALCRFQGSGLQTKVSLLQFDTVPYEEYFKAEVRTVFSKKNADLEKLCLLNPWIAGQHAAIINQCLERWGLKREDVDLVASHGQTVYHAPKAQHQQPEFGNATLQIGDGDHLAVATGIITISDFRQKHIAAGGEGAPLAVYGDRLIFGKQGENRILLNIGGIANFTYLPGSRNWDETFCTDTGPGNTMMDAVVQQFTGCHYDKDAGIAKQGRIDTALLSALKENDFFQKAFPKTTGPELFNLDYLHASKERAGTLFISAEDTMATLNKFSADTIAEAIHKTIKRTEPCRIFVSGGGIHNPLLMEHLKTALPEFLFSTTHELNIDPDAKEAVLFAVLANECICGDRAGLKKDTKGMPAVSMGKISFPF